MYKQCRLFCVYLCPICKYLSVKKTEVNWKEMQNGAVTLKDSLEVSYKTKHTLTMWSSSCAPWYSPKWAENLHPHKPVHECL